MKNGKYAIYLGKEYLSGKNKEGKIILRSTDINDVQNGFEPCEPFYYKSCENAIVCLKCVNCSEIEQFYRITTKANYAGFEFEVMEEKEGKILLVSLNGDYRDWLKLGMECIDKGVYQKWIEKKDAVIREEIEELK